MNGLYNANLYLFNAFHLGIKLMQELIDRTQDEMDLQYLAQCVCHHRKVIGHTKKDYEKLSSV